MNKGQCKVFKVNKCVGLEYGIDKAKKYCETYRKGGTNDKSRNTFKTTKP